jgi:uncharacterized membrane protein/gas vesicle protein
MTRMPRSLIGAAIGAAAMYLLDPKQGRRRRALLRDQLASSVASLDDAAGVTWRDTKNRLKGAASHLHRDASRHDADEAVLIERVRSHLGRAVSHPKAVHVLAEQGHITLQGAILEHERDAVLRAVESTPGVVDVTDRLHGFENAGDIPSLQGGRDRQRLAEWRQANWSPAMRLLAGIGGASLLGMGAARRRPFGLAALAAGSALLLRAARNEPFRETRRQVMRGRIEVRKTITVNAPIEEVFETMSRYENFPQFMRNVRSVERRSDDISHWQVVGPAGVTVEWDSQTTRHEPNRLIAWRSLPGSTVEHEGSISFEPVEGRATRVTVEMRYRPPAGAIGHAGARLFGADAQTELDEDLLRLKTTLETGKPPRDAAASSAASRFS